MTRKPVSLESGWGTMMVGINKLIRILEGKDEEQFKAEEYMQMYTLIYDMCTQKPPNDYSEQLYSKYREAFSLYVSQQVLPSLREHSDETLLKQLLKRWDNHKLMVRWLSRFFNYLDRYYVLRHSLHPLRDVGLLVFKDQVYDEIKSRSKNAVLMLAERERSGELVDRTLVKNILGIYIEVGMGTMECYEKDFEAYLLTDTATFYKKRAAEWIEQDSCPDYLIKAEQCLKDEEERVEGYFHTSTKPKLLREVETEVLAKYELNLLQKEHSGCAALLRDDKSEDLSRMFRLFQRIPRGLEPIAELFKEHVVSEGEKLVKEVTEAVESKRDKDKDAAAAAAGGAKAGAGPKEAAVGGSTSHEQQYVKSVIDLHDKFLQYVHTCFSNTSIFHKALKEAFETFCNKNVAGSTSAELMSSFCDNLLKKGGTEKLSDEAIEENLDKVVKLLAYINDKDMFAEFYRKKLAKRLLHSTSSSDDHERSIITRLKQQCGAQFTAKMEGMVTDLALAREKQQAFDEWLTNQDKKLKLDFSVTVLTTGHWPTYKQIDLALPQEMADCVDTFKAFYNINNNNRKLIWYFSHGSATIKANFDTRPIELVLSTQQAACLMLFNDAEELSLPEVTERMKIDEEDTLRTLHSLACSKFKLLGKDGNPKSIAKTDKFTFNGKFTSTQRRLKVPLPPVDEKKKIIEDVESDRKYLVDAAIVRTMKSRKAMLHQQLIMEVVAQLQRMFKPDIKQIKKRIDDLIGREFLERDKENPSLFRYLA